MAAVGVDSILQCAKSLRESSCNDSSSYKMLENVSELIKTVKEAYSSGEINNFVYFNVINFYDCYIATGKAIWRVFKHN